MSDDPVAEFGTILRDAGLILPAAPIFDDRIHHVPTVDKPRHLNGRYRVKLETSEKAIGWYRNWATDTASTPWSWFAEQRPRLTREQYRHLDEERAARAVEQAKALQERYEQAAMECQALLAGASTATGNPYLARKGIPSPGMAQGTPGQSITVIKNDEPLIVDLAGRLFIPMQDLDGKIWSLQYINPDGGKWYHPGGRKEGCFFPFDIADNRENVIICEGFATAVSLAEIMPTMPVVAAFDAGNLAAVAKAWKQRYPAIGVIVAADNDHKKARELKADGTLKPNVGKVAAEAAAEAVGGVVVLPEFAPEESSLSDWNDFSQKHGLEHARAAFRRALQLGERNQRPGGSQR